MKRFLSIAIAALAIHANSQANVMYQWQAVDDATPSGVTMTMVFSDDAVAQGTLNYHVAQFGTPSATGLEYFGFGVDGITPMSWTPADGAFRYGLGILDLTLRFGADGDLSGTIYANDGNSDVSMASTGALFTISAMHSDQDMSGSHIACGGDPACSWSSGMLVRVDPQPGRQAEGSQVPEPGSLALFGLGLAGLGWRLRRRA